MRNQFQRVFRPAVLALVVLSAGARAPGADTLTWNTNQNIVSADIHSVELLRLLEGVSQVTGWQVYLESNTTFTVSAKFKDLQSGAALRHMLGDLNFALVPQTNTSPRFYVFRSSQRNATMLVHPADLNSPAASAKAIPNELVVTLKPGAKIDSLACVGSAKITGRIDSLNTFRLKFDTEAAARTARECLANNSDVDSVDSNFAVERPIPAVSLDANIAQDFNLKPKDPNGDCPVIVGLVDTGFTSLGKDLDKFILPSLSTADGGLSSTSGGTTPRATGSDSPTALTHGAAMAETILRSIQTTTSGNSSVKILPVDVYGNNAATTTFDVAQGIYRAINAGANVINLSLGSPGDSTALHNLIKSASDQGVVFFGAAGNEPVTTPVYPAAYPEVVAVTAGDRNGQIAGYANRGSFVDIMTPGTSVVPFNGQSFVVSGTSAATAYASGIAAGLADANRDCPPKVIPTMRSKLPVKLESTP